MEYQILGCTGDVIVEENRLSTLDVQGVSKFTAEVIAWRQGKPSLSESVTIA